MTRGQGLRRGGAVDAEGEVVVGGGPDITDTRPVYGPVQLGRRNQATNISRPPIMNSPYTRGPCMLIQDILGLQICALRLEF